MNQFTAGLSVATYGPRAGRWRIGIVVAKRLNDATDAKVGDVLATVGRRPHHDPLADVPNLPNVPNLFPSG
jgi:hypothetical protein